VNLIHNFELLVVHGTVINANLKQGYIWKYSFNLQ